jgi:biofilm protein TabA
VAGLSVTMPYEPAKDVALFAASETMIPVPIRAGQCMILFPEDAHAPCCTWGDPAEVFKVVVKVAVADPR